MTSFDFDVIGDTPQRPLPNVQAPNAQVPNAQVPGAQVPASPVSAAPEVPPDNQARAETGKVASKAA
ncbi:hypothetical protein A8950_1849 [Dongia mobilis]|uniref:Uncharacterized protein n=1 Tax=Dongia mobilis TaxID=578943 RepID=A0A4R6WM22_9PROT|nr:hypothetical protein [Dongia mobilis]TDQ82029.1 hypothetical protein A8950_1849 [Dongia mobilis]